MNSGWIKIHRQLKDHWIWTSEKRLKWWLDILLTVNHCDSSVLVKGTLIECKRGQSIRSLSSWSKEWNVSKGAVRDFFKLLESDLMLIVESLQSTTRITVCNYDDYQDQINDKETQRKRKKNAKETPTLSKQEDTNKLVSKECKEGQSVFSDFYLEQIRVGEAYKETFPDAKKDLEDYKEFVKFIFDWKNHNHKDPLGNSLHSPLRNVLSLKNQLKFNDFAKHQSRAREFNLNFLDIIRKMDNRPDIMKKRADLNKTLYDWIKPFDK